MGGELPIRWSAVEVLTEAKYSKASDVWAFGIMVFEVMSRGKQPYAEFATLGEVVERIKDGYTMACPPGCREEIHELVMMRCWNPDAKCRPGFSALATTLVDLGAVPAEIDNDDDDVSIMGDREVSTMNAKMVQKSRDYLELNTRAWKKDMKNREYLGPSVHHLQTGLFPRVVATVQPPWRSSFDDKPVEPPEAATVFHMVEAVVKPAGASKKCPRDGKMGSAYVDTLKKQNDVGRATALLSYTWGYKILSIGNALQRWAERVERDPKRTYIWICSLCLNQHRISLQDTKTPDELANEFGPRVQAIGRVSLASQGSAFSMSG